MNKYRYLLEQCNLTGGRQSSLAMSVFLMDPACSNDFPLTHSVAKELDAANETILLSILCLSNCYM